MRVDSNLLTGFDSDFLLLGSALGGLPEPHLSFDLDRRGVAAALSSSSVRPRSCNIRISSGFIDHRVLSSDSRCGLSLENTREEASLETNRGDSEGGEYGSHWSANTSLRRRGTNEGDP